MQNLGQLVLCKKYLALLIWNAWLLPLCFSALGFPHIVTNRENLVSLCFSHACCKTKLSFPHCWQKWFMLVLIFEIVI